MKEEARAKQAEAAAAAGLGSLLLQDLVLLDGVYDRHGFQQVKHELPVLMPPAETLQHLPDRVDDEVLDRILQDDGQADAGALCKSLDATAAGLEALGELPEGKTSPVDVGESCWDNLDFSDYWLTPSADQPAMSLDASAFLVDDDVFVADV
ncbi:unnamed protein product [Phytophthora fragariaefolia]|uniref:Unnamed protein product n=1 Tax=Phytophthora fragariaefolia TaxID=1490495 RepID=A0A9W6XQ81_9STRA|nr:unnamed protein product [Phytophthora fragariaefolia]